jgi:hypothetical protein
MTTRKTSDVKKNSHGKTVRHDLSVGYSVALTILHMEGSAFRREKAEGTVLSVGESEIEISTNFPLKPNQMLYWVDRHKKGNFHYAMVKWSKKSDDTYQAGLSILVS